MMIPLLGACALGWNSLSRSVGVNSVVERFRFGPRRGFAKLGGDDDFLVDVGIDLVEVLDGGDALIGEPLAETRDGVLGFPILDLIVGPIVGRVSDGVSTEAVGAGDDECRALAGADVGVDFCMRSRTSSTSLPSTS